MKYGIYVASRPRHIDMWQQQRNAGIPIISTWIDKNRDREMLNLAKLWLDAEHEVVNAERLVLFVEKQDFPLKGVFVEIGMALAAKVPIYLVLGSDVEVKELGSWTQHPCVYLRTTLHEAFIT